MYVPFYFLLGAKGVLSDLLLAVFVHHTVQKKSTGVVNRYLVA